MHAPESNNRGEGSFLPRLYRHFHKEEEEALSAYDY